MQVAVIANDRQWDELMGSAPTANCIRVDDDAVHGLNSEVAALIDLRENAAQCDHSLFTKPVIINAVTQTLQEMKAPANLVRINGWAGFLQRPVWEVAGVIDENTVAIFAALNKKISIVKDEPGFIAARVISMIVNEAYFALGDNVSTKGEIDTAMKLGTNYPWGPFEWSATIGLQHILGLLQQLSATDKRYLPAPALMKEITSLPA